VTNKQFIVAIIELINTLDDSMNKNLKVLSELQRLLDVAYKREIRLGKARKRTKQWREKRTVIKSLG